LSNIENLKRSIQTILDLLPNYLLRFELYEREMITDFLAVINNFEEADNNRLSLINQFDRYSEKVRKTTEYHTTPFLWFTVILTEQAICNLSISRFHALEFYKFLLYQLRDLHKLIKKEIKLSSYEYEELQIKCGKADFKLTSDELEMLKTTFSAIESGKSESLRSKYIKRKIITNIAISSKYKRESEISRFYTLIDGKWWFQYTSSCFGLDRVFFHIHLESNIEINQIIDFNDSNNTVLGQSDVYQLLNSKDEYMGAFLIPDRDIERLHDYLRQCEQKNYLKIKEFAIVTQKRRNTTLTLYKPDSGWQILPKKEQKDIIQQFQLQKVEEKEIDYPRVPPQWSFTEYPYPLDIIKLYCKSPDQFSYSRLPFDKIKGEKGKNSQQLSIAEIGILKYLINKKALEVGFTPWRLVYNYSVSEYFIKLPKISIEKLAPFLKVFPYRETYFLERNIYIRTLLPVEIVSLIKNDLKWTIHQVSRTHPIPDMNFSWFDNTRLEWISPKVLQM
jgi:hypothetical protein